jgi:hypothetical protein
VSEHSGGTDKTHTIKLPSAIQRARWAALAAAAGTNVSGEVYTQFVSDGSKVTVEVRTKSGKTVGKAAGQVAISRCLFTLKLPENVNEDVYFEAQLPSHALKARSDLLKVLPPRSITNAKWSKSEARRGDALKLTADVKGIAEGSEVGVEIFEHDPDGANDLVSQLSAPVKGGKIELEWEYDYKDDTVQIPTKDEAEKGYSNPQFFFRASACGASADSGMLVFKDWVEIEMRDAGDKPLADEEYVAKLADGTEKRGKLDKDGRAKIDSVPPGPLYVEYPKQ